MKKNKFIVPLVFSLDDYDFAQDLYARPFYNFIYFSYKNKVPIIVQERYLISPEELKKKESTKWYFDKWSMDQFGYEILTKKDIEKIDKYIIKDETCKKICEPFKDQSEAFLDILQKGNNILEKELLNHIDRIEEKYKRRIDAFLVWVNNKAVEKVCSKRKIKLVQMEMGPVRNLDWATTIAYCMDRDKYDNEYVRDEYERFKKDIPKKEILSKDELLALFLKKEDKRYLFEKNRTPKYKYGVALSFPRDYFFNVHSKFSNEEIYEKTLQLADNSRVCVRSHPGSVYDLGKHPNYDDSINSKDFILKNETIISGVSNINFQAMLFNRKSISVSDKMPWSFLDGSDLSYVPDSSVDAMFLNYLVFCYYAPLKEMFDVNYLEYKFFEKNTLYDLYRRNREIILKKRGLNETIFKLPNKERARKIITTCFSKDTYDDYIDYCYEEVLENENDALRAELSKIQESRGYRYLEKIWKIKGRIKK